MMNALKYLDGDEDIFRYAWFSGRSIEIPTSDLLSSQVGVLNNLGIQYIDNTTAASTEIEPTAEPREEITVEWLIGVLVVIGLAIVVFGVVFGVVAKRKQDKQEIV